MESFRLNLVCLLHPDRTVSGRYAGFYLEKILGGEASFKGCVSCPRGWVREGCVPPPARSAEAEPFLITKLMKALKCKPSA